jgi:predicted small lipoprotein YifL
MKKFRSILVLMLVAAMIFSFAGCGSKDSGGNDAAPSEQSQEGDNSGTDTQEPSDSSSSSVEQSEEANIPEGSTAPIPGSGTPPEEANKDSNTDNKEEESSDQPVAEVPDDLKGDYTGEFVSDTGTGLNLITKWAAAKNAAGSYDVTFHFYLSTYSIQVSDRSGNRLEVKTASGKQDYTFKTKAVDKKDNKLESIFIGQTTVQMTADELNAGADVKAVWDFRGSYSDKELKEVTAEGKVKSN